MTQLKDFNIKNYCYQDFLEECEKRSEEFGCILCGEKHSLKIHVYCIRLVRSNTACDEEPIYRNIRIKIFSIY